MPTPKMVIGNSEGEGVSKAKIFKGKYEAKLEIPGGWEGPNQKTILGGGMDIFWNHTFKHHLNQLRSLRSIQKYKSIKKLPHTSPTGKNLWK